MSITASRAEFNMRLHILRNAQSVGRQQFPITTMGVRMTEAVIKTPAALARS